MRGMLLAGDNAEENTRAHLKPQAKDRPTNVLSREMGSNLGLFPTREWQHMLYLPSAPASSSVRFYLSILIFSVTTAEEQ